MVFVKDTMENTEDSRRLVYRFGGIIAPVESGKEGTL